MIRFRNRLIKFTFVVLAVLLGASAVVAFASAQSKKKQAALPSPPPSPVEKSGMSATTLAKPRSEYQFPVGQTYVYSGDWRIFNAGIGTLRLEQAGPENRVVGTANAMGTVALLYHVHDRFESFFDPASFCSRNTFRHVEEGLRRVETNITFDYQHGKTIFDQKNIRKKETKHEEHEIPNCVTDLLSAVYYVASLPLQPGGIYSFPLNDGGQTLTVNVRVEAREQVKTPAGTFNAIRIQPESAAGLLKDKGKIWIWYSDDAARTPVQMKARMTWGTLTFMLQRVEKK
ncbi:MAG: DUF3108 domain-containing protein [Candidatus Angelobacter sp.]